jgi:drug/metabolite transporter (DMT)-like permease
VGVIVSARAEARPERLWFGVWTAVLAAVAWAVSTVMMKPPLREIEPLTAQAVRLPLACVLLFLTPWSLGEGVSLSTIAGAVIAVAGIVVLQLRAISRRGRRSRRRAASARDGSPESVTRRT